MLETASTYWTTNFNEYVVTCAQIVGVTEKYWMFLKHSLPPAPAASADNQALADWNALFDRHNEVACLMLGTMYALESAARIPYVPNQEGRQELVYLRRITLKRKLWVTLLSIPPENKIVVERYAYLLEKDFILQKESGRNVELDDEDILPSENTSEHPIEEEKIDPDRLSFNIKAEEHSLGDLYEPANYKAALSNPEFEKWLVAMNEEMQSMNNNKVWKLVVLPLNAKAVKSKWIYKKKTDMDGKEYIYKARLVAKGFTQSYDVDYEETVSPVADIRAIRILIAIAAYYDYEIWQMDVKTVFLNGFLEEEIYMEQPKGFIDPNHPSKVCKLQRSIYGLKQASRSWNKRFDEEIKKFSFHQNLNEPCVYRKASGSNLIFLILYVDDIILMGNHIPSLQEVKDYLGKCFSMKDLGEAAFILGIKIYRDRSRRLIGLSQNAYLDKILKRYRMDNSKRGSIPMQVDLHLNKSQCATTSAEMKRMQNVPYASAVGSIMYAVRCTRPDVAFAQNITSRFQQNPGEAHWTAVKNILKYLRNTKDTFLVYGGNPEAELQVKCYCDAGFETDRDDTKSQTGYVFVLNGGAVVWKSSKQSTTAQHATEAEYIAASEAAKEAVWIRKFIDELGVVPSNDYPIKMNCDNSAAIIIAKESGIQKGARHFQRKYHYVRECIKTGEIDIVKVHTDENLADPFTKALAGPKLTRHARSMGLRPASSFIHTSCKGHKFPNGPPSRFPSLMLAQKSKDKEFRELLLLSNKSIRKKSIRKIRLPQIYDKVFMTSCGWLVTVGEDFSSQLINPLSCETINLPKFKLLDQILPLVVVSWGWDRQLGFCQPGDIKWTRVKRVVPKDFYYGSIAPEAYLFGVDDEERKRLLVLIREGKRMKDTFKTKIFLVFAYDLEKGTWSKVKDLGTKALFVGDASFSIDQDTTGVIKGNSIYFTDDAYFKHGLRGNGKCRDMGIYHLSDGTLTLLQWSNQLAIFPHPILAQSMSHTELRRAIAVIQDNLQDAIRRNTSAALVSTEVTDASKLVKPGVVGLVLGIRREYAKELEESQERARKLRSDLVIEEHRKNSQGNSS
ncbi:retrotransposon protein, putative, ty1-copia subclass [Tanacetum coccineum]